VGGLSLEYSKGLLGFLPLLRRVSQDISCVLVHGISSCDLGYCSNCEWCSCIFLCFNYMTKMK
jgi:hypothetical protein